MVKKNYGFSEETKDLFRIKWKTLSEIIEETKKQLKKEKKRK